MIDYKDIKKAINSIIRMNFTAKVNSKDIKEGFERPSFFVKLDDIKQQAYDEQIYRSITIRIFYFPSDRDSNSIELIEVQQKLEEVFDLKLRIQDRFLDIDEIESNIVDGILEFYFSIEFYDARDTSYADKHSYDDVVDEHGNEIEVEMMEKLHIKE